MPSDSGRVFLSAGEASGEALGAALVTRMRDLAANGGARLSFEGIGSSQMEAAGVRLVANSKDWGAISITESAKVSARCIRGFRLAKAVLRQGKPGLFIPIDFGFFNVRLERIAKAAGWKTLYFMPPGSWKRRTVTAGSKPSDLAVLSDAVVTPFDWSKEHLQAQGANVFWFGHPVLELLEAAQDQAAPRPEGDRERFLAVLPGSRSHELKANLPLFAESIPSDMRAKFVVAPTLNPASLEAEWRRLAPHRRDEFIQEPALSVLGRAHAAVIVSGTASLEAAVAGCPMAVVYRLTPLMSFEVRLIGFKRPPLVALPNIILNERVIPELVAIEATAAACREVIDRIWNDDAARQGQTDAFTEIKVRLGGRTAIADTAALALELLTGKPA